MAIDKVLVRRKLKILEEYVHIIEYMSFTAEEMLKSKEKIISKKLANQMKDACGFRNLVVHHYGKIDFRKLYRNYKDDLADLRQFAKEIWEFLER